MIAHGEEGKTHPCERYVAKRHFGAVEVEEVHELDRLAVAKSAVVHTARLVVKLEVDWEDFHMLCET